MAEATITLKLSPKEFDLLRSVLQERRESLHQHGFIGGGDPEQRSKQRRLEAQIADLLTRLA